jgi:hypothetical protein
MNECTTITIQIQNEAIVSTFCFAVNDISRAKRGGAIRFREQFAR